MLRLLHLIDSLAVGGSQRQLTMLAAEQARSGHDVHLAIRRGGPLQANLEGKAVTLHSLETPGGRDPRVLPRLLRLVRTLRPDIVQTWLPYMDVFGGAVARLAGVRWVMTERASQAAYEQGILSWLRRRVASGSDALVANSRTGDDYWRERLPPARRYVVNNALPLESIRLAAGAGSTEPGAAALILFAGRMVTEKNVVRLTRALELTCARTDAVALLCGDGPERATVEARVRQAGLERRIILEPFRRDVDLWAVMARSAAFVSVSLQEGQPNAVLEAMACGSPLVVSDIPGHREILDESSAWIVDPYDPESIAQALVQAVEDPTEARRRAQAATEAAQGYALERAVSAYDRVYANALRARAG